MHNMDSPRMLQQLVDICSEPRDHDAQVCSYSRLTFRTIETERELLRGKVYAHIYSLSFLLLLSACSHSSRAFFQWTNELSSSSEDVFTTPSHRAHCGITHVKCGRCSSSPEFNDQAE